jgi:hypothetical protein
MPPQPATNGSSSISSRQRVEYLPENILQFSHLGVTEIFPKRRVSLAKQGDRGTQFPRNTLVWWLFGGFAAKVTVQGGV